MNGQLVFALFPPAGNASIGGALSPNARSGTQTNEHMFVQPWLSMRIGSRGGVQLCRGAKTTRSTPCKQKVKGHIYVLADL